jgi:hypothetical protein
VERRREQTPGAPLEGGEDFAEHRIERARGERREHRAVEGVVEGKSVMTKMDAASLSELVRMALSAGILGDSKTQ